MNILEGKLVAEGLKIGIVVGRFNEFIGSKLLSGCVDGLVRHGVNDSDIDVAWVPGAFEIPVIAKKNGTKRQIQCNNLPRRSNKRSNLTLRLCLCGSF